MDAKQVGKRLALVDAQQSVCEAQGLDLGVPWAWQGSASPTTRKTVFIPTLWSICTQLHVSSQRVGHFRIVGYIVQKLCLLTH